MKTIAVVIPHYRKKLTREEKISINHLNEYLNKYDKFLVLPESIKNLPLKTSKLKILHFPSSYFASLSKYSELMLSREFYEKFTGYKYILIYQLDALVFSDKLNYWCKKNYDYIGAPLFNSLIGKLTGNTASKITVGNGGFSLRKVSSFIKVIDLSQTKAKKQSNSQFERKIWFLKALLNRTNKKIWLNAPANNYPFNEDGFWSFEAIKYYPKFKIAPLKEAFKFAFERFPNKCFELNSSKLPFGSHAWQKYNINFWNPYLKK